jgi:hypothetical protein
MRRRIRLQQSPDAAGGPPTLLVHFSVPLDTRRGRGQFGELVEFCHAEIGDHGAIGWLSRDRLAVLVPWVESRSITELFQQLSRRWQIEARAELLGSLDEALPELAPPLAAAASRWRGCKPMISGAGRAQHRVGLSKRTLDVILAVVGLVLLSPLFLLVALTIKITSPGPVLSVVQRRGQRGRRCRIYRFRARVCEPPARTLTPVGGVLRETRLEQLPQLWNVLRGDLSL